MKSEPKTDPMETMSDATSVTQVEEVELKQLTLPVPVVSPPEHAKPASEAASVSLAHESELKLKEQALPAPVVPPPGHVQPGSETASVSLAPGSELKLKEQTLPAPVIPPVHARALPAPVTGNMGAVPPKPPGAKNSEEHGDSDGHRMGFMDHLMELRHRLWICAVTIIACMTLSLIFYQQLFSLMRTPLNNVNNDWRNNAKALAEFGLKVGDDIVQLITTDPLDTMLMVVWLGVGAGLLISSPMVFNQLWGFVAPGLKENERNAIRPILYGGIFFFIIGVAIAYFFLFPVSLSFFVWLDVDLHIRPSYTVEKYMSLLINVMAVSGLSCELPLVIGALSKLRIVKPSHLTQYWRMCILTAFILGAVLSPGTDLMSMLVFSALFLGLYFVSVLMAYFFYPKTEA